MFCQSEPFAGHSSHPSVLQLRQSSVHERISRNQNSFDFQLKSYQSNELLEQQITQEDKGTLGGTLDDNNNTLNFSTLQRYQLEKDVFGLQDRLQREVDLHHALENAFIQEAGVPKGVSNLPSHAKKLVSEVAMLELAILSLEEHIALLKFQLGCENRERLVAESTLLNLPFYEEVQRRGPNYRKCLGSPNALPSVMSPGSFIASSSCKNIYIQQPMEHFSASIKDGLPKSFSNVAASGSQLDNFVRNAQVRHCQQSGFFCPKKASPVFEEMPSKPKNPLDMKQSWNHPTKLSEEMVKCMISIYRHLSDGDGLSTSKRTASPTSPYGMNTFSSISSLSESSSMTSPPIDLRNKELGSDKYFDPYKLPDKVPWSDIGVYASAVDVSEMTVGKEQLEYAAEALRKFRSLVEQLSRVNPGIMKHNEKLAFWINVYNALMMHAYLAYGVPKNDFKFFSLMQKAAYTVGCHSFNAVVIEHLLLKAKAQWYRPQIALLMAHQKLKLREEVRTYAIDCMEPLVAFSLSFGARSSPAVRVYTPENVHNELQSAIQDYAQAAVGVSTKGKLLIPKLLYDFGLDIVEEAHILDWICHFLPPHQSNLIQAWLDRRQYKLVMSKHVSVIAFDFHFRYLFLFDGERSHRPEYM